MKKCKKMIILIMVFALCFGLSACGGGGSDNNDTVEIQIIKSNVRRKV